ncbi:MAG: hypothetical protein ACLP59_21180 [Bryobacteraceae bacterium]
MRSAKKRSGSATGLANRRSKYAWRERRRARKPAGACVSPQKPTEAPQVLSAHSYTFYPPKLASKDSDIEFYQPVLPALDRHNLLLAESGTAVTRLMRERDENVSDMPRPSDSACVRAQLMLLELADLAFDTAATDVYSDMDGAIRLLWTRDNRNAELVIPSIDAESPYLYHSDERDFGVEENPSANRVLKWLRWVLDDLSAKELNAA